LPMPESSSSSDVLLRLERDIDEPVLLDEPKPPRDDPVDMLASAHSGAMRSRARTRTGTALAPVEQCDRMRRDI